MTLHDLKEKRGTLVEQMRSIADAPADKSGDLSAAQKKTFDGLKSELSTLESRIARTEVLEDAERRMEGQVIAGSGDSKFDQESRSFSILRAVAHNAGMAVDAGREIEISAELARRAGKSASGIWVPTAVFEKRVTTTTAPAGGPGSNLIATDHLGAQFVDTLRAGTIVARLGARVLNGLQGNTDIPKRTKSAVVGWVAENAALTASDQEFNKVSLTPKHAGALTELSRNMLQQPSPDLEQLTRDDFAALLAEAIDGVAIDGGGTAQPTGILQTTGIGTVAIGTNGGALTIDHTADLIGKVDQPDAPDGTRAFIGSNKVRTAAMKLKDSNARPYGLPAVFHGEPFAFSSLVPSNLSKGTGSNLSALIYGNFADLIIGYWSQFDLLTNPFESTAYKKGNVQIRAMLTADVAVRHVESFAAITDIVA